MPSFVSTILVIFGGGSSGQENTNCQLSLSEPFHPQARRLVGLGCGVIPQCLGRASRSREGIHAHLVDELDVLMHAGKEGDELFNMGAKVLELLDAFAYDLLDLGLWKPGQILSVTPTEDEHRVVFVRIRELYHGSLGG